MPDQTSFEVVISCADEDRPITDTLVKALAERSIVSFFHRANVTKVEGSWGQNCPTSMSIEANFALPSCPTPI